MDRIKSGYTAATADPSTSLRSGRDDKGREVAQVGIVARFPADPNGPDSRIPVVRLCCWIFLSRWQGEEALKFLHIGQLTSG
jgi:hypothetical protein